MSIAKPTKAKIFIADDHPLIRAGFKSLIEEEADMLVSGEAEGYSQTLDLLQEERPDLLILDLSLKDGSGLDLIETLKTLHPEIKIIVVSVHDETLFAERVLHAGALGYVNKEVATEEMVKAIRSVLKGKVYLSESMTDRMLLSATSVSDSREKSPIERLSNRELEVFEMIGRGMGTQEIAEKIHRSVKTIETYRENIKQKLNLEKGIQLLRYAIQWTSEQR